jgi:thioredoxin-like negative regulator of GroEL
MHSSHIHTPSIYAIPSMISVRCLVAIAALLCLIDSAVGVDASYQVALKQAQQQQQPLLVLIGTNWCPGCQTMKTRVLPSLVQRGELRGVSFAHVDADKEVETAKQLMRGGTIPQLIVFSRKSDGQWHREQITGATSEAEVQSLIARALKAQQADGGPTAGAIGN